MFGYEQDAYDKKVYEEQIQDFLPNKIIDIHNHVYKKEFAKNTPRVSGIVAWTSMVASACPIEDLQSTYLGLFPGKTVKPVIMSLPTKDLEKGNAYIEQVAKENDLACYFCTSYDTPPEVIEGALTNKGFCGIKPYLNNRPLYIDGSETRIFDFLPHEHLEIVNRLKGIVMLHISRDARLKDPINLAQLMEIEEKYKDLQLIVAHIGRAYAPEDIGNAFEVLGKTKNMMFDFCANTCTDAMYACLKAVGTDRVMFGTDMPITKMKMKRVTKNGFYYNIVPKGLYGDVSSDPHMIETDDMDITNFAYEEIKAFKRTAEKLGLGKNDIEKIFYGNAARIINARGGTY
ncbi:MAG: amidohydrolase family protein [Clostridia bacterium]|nr:amidohydrolase family protein [Clostridia bacterium]